MDESLVNNVLSRKTSKHATGYSIVSFVTYMRYLNIIHQHSRRAGKLV